MLNIITDYQNRNWETEKAIRDAVDMARCMSTVSGRHTSLSGLYVQNCIRLITILLVSCACEHCMLCNYIRCQSAHAHQNYQASLIRFRHHLICTCRHSPSLAMSWEDALVQDSLELMLPASLSLSVPHVIHPCH